MLRNGRRDDLTGLHLFASALQIGQGSAGPSTEKTRFIIGPCRETATRPYLRCSACVDAKVLLGLLRFFTGLPGTACLPPPCRCRLRTPIGPAPGLRLLDGTAAPTSHAARTAAAESRARKIVAGHRADDAVCAIFRWDGRLGESTLLPSSSSPSASSSTPRCGNGGAGFDKHSALSLKHREGERNYRMMRREAQAPTADAAATPRPARNPPAPTRLLLLEHLRAGPACRKELLLALPSLGLDCLRKTNRLSIPCTANLACCHQAPTATVPAGPAAFRERLGRPIIRMGTPSPPLFRRPFVFSQRPRSSDLRASLVRTYLCPPRCRLALRDHR